MCDSAHFPREEHRFAERRSLSKILLFPFFTENPLAAARNLPRLPNEEFLEMIQDVQMSLSIDSEFKDAGDPSLDEYILGDTLSLSLSLPRLGSLSVSGMTAVAWALLFGDSRIFGDL